jgi:hypothetical protein
MNWSKANFEIKLKENRFKVKTKGVSAGSRYQITLDGAEVLKRC